ncbi:PAS domain-containing protein [Methanoregula sp.]|uniref:PAS domain-containing protein n=1 Tax=Methanoregula sp. TaxID=2052170 RepID=UPI000CB89BB2|nr:PAS domain-containing protein [Methanoregula sp.]PKG33704.1 MAG: hypothetical protein CW742_01605 [Methanoregula sp.]
MPPLPHCYRTLIAGVALTLLFCSIVLPAQAGSDPYRILIINSYHPGVFFSDREVQGVQEAFTGQKADFTLEYMDAKKITSPEYQKLLFDSYRMKYANTRFDAIISLDDDAFRFLLENADVLFPKTPVFFCGVNNFEDSMLEGNPLFTGVVETLSRNETIDLALALHPGTERIYVITDQTTSGEINRKILEKTVSAGRFPVPVIFLDDNRTGLSLAELKVKVAHLPQHSIVYYSDFFQDKDKVTYLPTEAMKEISAASSAPVYAHGSQYLGHGAVGGNMNSGLLQGGTAAKMALLNFSGIPVADIPVYKEGMNEYMVDENMARRWNIDMSVFPAGIRVINHPVSPLEKYWVYIVAIAIFVLIETWIIISLLISRRQRLKVEKDLRSADETLRSLINANPESVILFDPDGTILFSNEVAASRYHTTPDKALGKNIFSMMDPDLARRRRDLAEMAVRTRQSVRATDTRDGRSYDITFTPLPDADGKISKVATLGIDITESQNLQDTLARINRRLRNIAQLTRTDLANQTFTLQGYFELMKENMPERKRQEFLQKIQEMLDALVLSIGISRQYQDLGDRLPLWQDINKAFLYALSHVNTGATRRELLPEPVEVYADPHLEDAFMGLIQQTLSATPPATIIRLSGYEEDGSYFLLYEDDGPGIADTEREKLFQPEYPEYRTLFLASEILDITRITIRETGIAGKGLRFEIRIPAGGFRILVNQDKDPESGSMR